jgi:cytochrome c5
MRSRNIELVSLSTVIAVLVMACAMPQPRGAAEPRQQALTGSARGQLLYENHCTVCHTSVVHVQQDHRASSGAAVESWVRRWSVDQKLGWEDEEILDVTDFLLRRYYKF